MPRELRENIPTDKTFSVNVLSCGEVEVIVSDNQQFDIEAEIDDDGSVPPPEFSDNSLTIGNAQLVIGRHVIEPDENIKVSLASSALDRVELSIVSPAGVVTVSGSPDAKIRFRDIRIFGGAKMSGQHVVFTGGDVQVSGEESSINLTAVSIVRRERDLKETVQVHSRASASIALDGQPGTVHEVDLSRQPDEAGFITL